MRSSASWSAELITPKHAWEAGGVGVGVGVGPAPGVRCSECGACLEDGQAARGEVVERGVRRVGDVERVEHRAYHE